MAEAEDERQTWLEARQAGIFATDAGKILGLSQYGSALTVWRDKTSPIEQSPMSLPAWIGLKLESTVGEMYAQTTGLRLRSDSRTLWHPKYPFLGTHLDFRVWGQPKLLVECKTRAYMGGWGEEGTEDVPPDIWVQAQHEMLVTGAERCDIAVLFGHHTYRTYPIPRNELFLEKWIEQAQVFWHSFVEAKVPPVAAGTEADTEYLKTQHPTDDGVVKTATPEQAQQVTRLLRARTNVKQADAVKTEAENVVKQIIGDAAGLITPDASISWKTGKPTTFTDWELVAGVALNMVHELLEMADPRDEDVGRYGHIQALSGVVVGQYSQEKPGIRRFIVTPKEEA